MGGYPMSTSFPLITVLMCGGAFVVFALFAAIAVFFNQEKKK